MLLISNFTRGCNHLQKYFPVHLARNISGTAKSNNLLNTPPVFRMRGFLNFLVVLTLPASFPLLADSVSMRDYNLLSRGMNEAEVLYRLGPYDHETVTYGDYDRILRKTWYYLPAPHEVSNRQWITEIRFNGAGKIIHLDRYKARY